LSEKKEKDTDDRINGWIQQMVIP